MRKSKILIALKNELETIPSHAADEKKIIAVFNKLLKDFDITKEVSILDNLYLQPFKIEYIENSNGIKNYFTLDKQKILKADSYSKLVMKKDNKLISLKSFGKVSDMDEEQFEKLLLLVRLSQYVRKNRELYSLEIAILQIIS